MGIVNEPVNPDQTAIGYIERCIPELEAAGVPLAAWLTTKWACLAGSSPLEAITWVLDDYSEPGAEPGVDLVASLIQDALTLLELRNGS